MVRSTGPFWDAVHQTLWENFDPRTKRVMISLSNASVFDRVAERVPATAQPQRKSALAQIGAKRKQLEETGLDPRAPRQPRVDAIHHSLKHADFSSADQPVLRRMAVDGLNCVQPTTTLTNRAIGLKKVLRAEGVFSAEGVANLVAGFGTPPPVPPSAAEAESALSALRAAGELESAERRAGAAVCEWLNMEPQRAAAYVDSCSTGALVTSPDNASYCDCCSAGIGLFHSQVLMGTGLPPPPAKKGGASRKNIKEQLVWVQLCAACEGYASTGGGRVHRTLPTCTALSSEQRAHVASMLRRLRPQDLVTAAAVASVKPQCCPLHGLPLFSVKAARATAAAAHSSRALAHADRPNALAVRLPEEYNAFPHARELMLQGLVNGPTLIAQDALVQAQSLVHAQYPERMRLCHQDPSASDDTRRTLALVTPAEPNDRSGTPKHMDSAGAYTVAIAEHAADEAAVLAVWLFVDPSTADECERALAKHAGMDPAYLGAVDLCLTLQMEEFANAHGDWVVRLTQKHGQIVCVPPGWWHMVMNVLPCAKIAVETCHEGELAAAAFGRNRVREQRLRWRLRCGKQGSSKIPTGCVSTVLPAERFLSSCLERWLISLADKALA